MCVCVCVGVCVTFEETENKCSLPETWEEIEQLKIKELQILLRILCQDQVGQTSWTIYATQWYASNHPVCLLEKSGYLFV